MLLHPDADGDAAFACSARRARRDDAARPRDPRTRARRQRAPRRAPRYLADLLGGGRALCRPLARRRRGARSSEADASRRSSASACAASTKEGGVASRSPTIPSEAEAWLAEALALKRDWLRSTGPDQPRLRQGREPATASPSSRAHLRTDRTGPAHGRLETEPRRPRPPPSRPASSTAAPSISISAPSRRSLPHSDPATS